jgi:hypothetical protein
MLTAVAAVLTAATPASAATPPFNVIQFYDYCKAQAPLTVPSWCTGPGLYKVAYPVSSKSVPTSVLPNVGPMSQWSASGQEMVFQYGTFNGTGAGQYFVSSGIGVMNSSGGTTDILVDPTAMDRCS